MEKEVKNQEVFISTETLKELDEGNENENLKKIEAALFISARFLTLQELVMLTDINPLMIKELLQKLIDKYNNENSAIEILVKENMWKMDVKQDYVYMINKLATGNSEFSKAEQETLAVIAYKQPVKQSIIIKIRGNKAYDHIKRFREIGLVQTKPLGHTLELRLSDDFFEYFHLQKKEENGKIIATIDEIDEEDLSNRKKKNDNENLDSIKISELDYDSEVKKIGEGTEEEK
ncbi:MAG: SMC-Scp complex subunit ScpB [Candidatus Pacearchaeota archaeon]